MSYLLDTHAFIWATLDTKKLSEKVRNIVTDNRNEICVSTVSFWEISLKASIYKFSFEGVDVKKFPKYARDMDFKIVELKEQEAITFSNLALKNNHRDPFDRMIIWQSIVKKMSLISKDRLFGQYKEDGLQLIW